MKRWLLPLLLVLAAAGAVCVFVIVRETRERDARPAEPQTEVRQHAEDSRQALRKVAEFLQPDTKSDLRFGRSKSSPQTTPAPVTPR